MKLQASEIIRNLRTELGLSQEEFAMQIYRSARWVSRVENNDAEISMPELMDIMQKFGKPLSDIAAYASREYNLIRTYSSMISSLNIEDWSGYDKAMAELRQEAFKPIHHSYLDFFDAYANIIRNEIARNDHHQEFNDEDFAAMGEAMALTAEDFSEDTVEDCLLTYHEAFTVCNMSYALFVMGEAKRSIALAEKLQNNISIQMRQEYNENDALCMRVAGALIDSYIDNRMYSEGLVEGFIQLNRVVKAKNAHFLENWLHIVCSAYKALGEDADIFYTYARRNYYCTLMNGHQRNIDFARNHCESNGINLDYMPD